MNTRIIISLLCAGAIGVACSSRSHSEEIATPATAQPINGHPNIKSFLNVEHRNHGVRFALHVVNTSKKNVEFDFANGQAYDFVVLDSLGRQVWHWATDRMFTQNTQIKYVDSGQEFEVAESWQHPLRPGQYTAVATLTSTNFPVTERVPFTVR